MAKPSNEARITKLQNEFGTMQSQLSQLVGMVTQLTNGQAASATPQAIATATAEEWQPSERQIIAHWQQNGHMTRDEIIADLQAIYAEDLDDEADDEATEIEPTKPAATNRQRRQSRKLSRTKRGLPKPQTAQEREFGLALRDYPEAAKHVSTRLAGQIIKASFYGDNVGDCGEATFELVHTANGRPVLRLQSSSISIDLLDGTAVVGRLGYKQGVTDIALHRLVQ